jgi:hypothetical protein
MSATMAETEERCRREVSAVFTGNHSYELSSNFGVWFFVLLFCFQTSPSVSFHTSSTVLASPRPVLLAYPHHGRLLLHPSLDRQGGRLGALLPGWLLGTRLPLISTCMYLDRPLQNRQQGEVIGSRTANYINYSVFSHSPQHLVKSSLPLSISLFLRTISSRDHAIL